jgi:hypothetical protein
MYVLALTGRDILYCGDAEEKVHRDYLLPPHTIYRTSAYFFGSRQSKSQHIPVLLGIQAKSQVLRHTMHLPLVPKKEFEKRYGGRTVVLMPLFGSSIPHRAIIVGTAAAA